MWAVAQQPSDIGGVQLAAAFSAEVVEPLLAKHFPALQYASALVGPGSEILGFDDSTSRDHDWGPRLMLFLEPMDRDEYGAAVEELLRRLLPTTFKGYPCHWEDMPDDNGVMRTSASASRSGNVNHRVKIHTVGAYFFSYLGANPQNGLQPKDWLSIPQHKLRTVVEGGVFRDDVGTLTRARAVVAAYYPRDVWLYMIHAGYSRLSDLSHLMGRCGQTGDELGSLVIAARLVHEVMHLCFLLERTFAPYSKWFGRAFALLQCAEAMLPLLHAAMDGGTHAATLAPGDGPKGTKTCWEARDEALAGVYTLLGEALNVAEVIEVQEHSTHVRQFWCRPFRVPSCAVGPPETRVTTLLAAAVQDPHLRALCEQRPIGAAEQYSSGRLLEEPKLLFELGETVYGL